MSTKQIEALKLALEALESDWDGCVNSPKGEAIAAIREALAEPRSDEEQPAQQQEPVAWRWTESNGRHWFDWRTDWTHHDRAKAMGFAIEYAYTSPPASKPLTDEEIWDEVKAADLDWQTGWSLDEDASNRYITFARAIEAAHGIKEKRND